MKSSRFIILCFLLFYGALKAPSQNPATDSNTRFFGVPLLFYSPDTRLGFGAAGIITFPTAPYRSSITFGLAYTQRKQFLIYLPYQFFGRNDAWRVYGELGWYRYHYQYFGIGNGYSNNYAENYTVQYPRIRITAAHRLQGKLFAGLRWYMDDFHFREIEEDGEIAEGILAGSRGGTASSLGAVWLFDTRDNQFFPGKGWLIEASVTGDDKLTGSDFHYGRISLEATHYRTFFKNHKLAFNFVSIITSRGVPFFNMALISTPRRLRGYPEGKYRDRNLILTQAEWRFPLVWRFKGVLFAGTGAVFGTKGDVFKLRPNAGLGLRFEFDRKQQLHLRLDYGFGQGKGNSGAYITIGEAF